MYVALAVVGAVVVVAVGLDLRERHRDAPLRREM